jgi:hypothetical protein
MQRLLSAGPEERCNEQKGWHKWKGRFAPGQYLVDNYLGKCPSGTGKQIRNKSGAWVLFCVSYHSGRKFNLFFGNFDRIPAPSLILNRNGIAMIDSAEADHGLC